MARFAAYAGLILGFAALCLAGSGLYAVVLGHDPSGWAGPSIGAPVGVAAWWLVRRGISVDDRAEAAGTPDGLPYGAYRVGPEIGLEADDFYLGLGLGIVCVALVIGVTMRVGGSAPRDAALVAGLLGVWGLPALRVGSGTRYWVSPTEIRTARRPRRSVEWAVVTRVLWLYQGQPEHGPSAANAMELQTSRPLGGWLLPHPRDFVIRSGTLEISGPELLEVLQETAPAGVPIRWP